MSNADYPSERYSAEEKALLAEYRDVSAPLLICLSMYASTTRPFSVSPCKLIITVSVPDL